MRTFFGQAMRGLRPGFQALLALALLAGLFGSLAPQTAEAAVPIPIFYITTVEKDNTVSIKTYNFPANRTFVVRMGKFGTLGIGGIEVATTQSGTGGTFTATYNIPAALKGLSRIAIRLDGTSGGYYSYNWFWNNTATVTVPGPTATPGGLTATPGPTATPGSGYTGIPTFVFTEVVKDTSVTIKTNNFPAKKSFTARMGKYGTLGIGGIVVGTTDSGTGGTFTVTYKIPAELKGEARLHLRLEASGGYYSYNWFWNNPDAVPPTPPPYTGIPTFTVTSVTKDTSVTIKTNNFPANRTFLVRMGKYGTLGIGGIQVDTVSSGEGGVLTMTFKIPADLKGQSQIAIRLDATTGGFYSYNWFWNN